MKLSKALLAIAAALFCAAGNANANAQSLQVVAIGSSALYLESGQAAALSPSIGASCAFTVAKGTVQAIDSRPGITATTENGAVWVAYQPSSTGSCYTGSFSSSKVYMYISTDSTVGDRCVMASPACTVNFPSSLVGAGGANSLPGVTDITSGGGGLPSAIQTALNGASFNVAGTDIRAEDAKFATVRALTPCGQPVDGVSGTSQYLGLGYATGNPHIGTAIQESTQANASPGSFHVYDFNLVGTDPLSGNAVSTYTTVDVGAVPIVVFVNPANPSGFGSLLVGNVTRLTLAGYLDGTYGRAGDMVDQGYAAASGPGHQATMVFVREPLSGTYNTMEYAVPNSVAIKTSQDAGVNAPSSIDSFSPNCSGSSVGANPLADTSVTRHSTVTYAGSTAGRFRAIGTGDEVAAVLKYGDSLGYSFWSAANFANASAVNAKYLTVDGIDPLQQVWTDGLVPTSGNGLLGNVSLANVRNGSYPIWSKLRFVATPTGVTGATALASGAASFVSPTQPDFIPTSQLEIVRSHFAPPYDHSSSLNVDFLSSGTDVPSNGTGVSSCGSNPEAGGDVGGLVISLQSEGDFCNDVGAGGGQVGRRQ
jgi:hypothetical protein